MAQSVWRANFVISSEPCVHLPSKPASPLLVIYPKDTLAEMQKRTCMGYLLHRYLQQRMAGSNPNKYPSRGTGRINCYTCSVAFHEGTEGNVKGLCAAMQGTPRHTVKRLVKVCVLCYYLPRNRMWGKYK